MSSRRAAVRALLLPAACRRAAADAREATDTIPIVAVIPDADSQAFIGSTPRSRGNLTAITTDAGPSMPKRLELLKTFAPRASRPTVFDVAVNARTARALGLAIPPSLQLRITRTIG